ncbi:MAG: hypothetical protein AABY86_06955, partial [Bdellovibrionota bacterium]
MKRILFIVALTLLTCLPALGAFQGVNINPWSGSLKNHLAGSGVSIMFDDQQGVAITLNADRQVLPSGTSEMGIRFNVISVPANGLRLTTPDALQDMILVNSGTRTNGSTIWTGLIAAPAEALPEIDWEGDDIFRPNHGTVTSLNALLGHSATSTGISFALTLNEWGGPVLEITLDLKEQLNATVNLVSVGAISEVRTQLCLSGAPALVFDASVDGKYLYISSHGFTYT